MNKKPSLGEDIRSDILRELADDDEKDYYWSNLNGRWKLGCLVRAGSPDAGRSCCGGKQTSQAFRQSTGGRHAMNNEVRKYVYAACSVIDGMLRDATRFGALDLEDARSELRTAAYALVMALDENFIPDRLYAKLFSAIIKLDAVNSMLGGPAPGDPIDALRKLRQTLHECLSETAQTWPEWLEGCA